MRFTCDACNAQYMISDEKVGPNGVKVRCKKCGHIILVKRASEAAAAAPEPPAPAAAPLSNDGLDAELGQAFDKVLGETPPPAGDAAAPAAAAAAEPPGGAAPGEPAAQAGPGNEWYVAVDDQQVGPLAAPAVKGKWESGEIGPDSLVWKPGLDDWKPLSQVPELQQFLAPVPRPSGRPRPTARPPPPTLAAPAAAPAAAPREPEWKPAAASALAALASEEMATIKGSEPVRRAPAAAARPGGRASLVDAMNLPEGGVDPTGAIPLPIKGLEKTGESRLERKSSVARTTAELRIKRSANRTIMVVSVLMLLLLAGGVGGVFYYFQQRIPWAAPQADAPQAPRTFAPPIPAPAPQPPPFAPVAPQAAAPQPAAPQAAPQTPPSAASPAPAPASPGPTPTATRRRPAPTAAPAEKPAPRKVAQAEPPPTPAPAPAPKKKGSSDPFAASGGGEDEFEKLLNESPKRSVYVPPAPGGEVAERVSTGQIQEAVAGKMAALRDCLAKQQAAQPDSHGQVVLAWDIEPDGRASAISPQVGGNQPFAQCLVGVVKSIRFPKSRLGNKGDDKVKFPFTY